MNKKTKNIVLVIVVVLIAASIWYLQAKKPHNLGADAPDVMVGGSENASSTEASSTTVLGDRSAIRADKASTYPKAKELVSPSGFINTGPFKLSDIVGKKVVLIDFWTYSCINCQRTIPYLNAWYQKYKDDGLVIVGVHTPEFDFEKDYDNVSKGVKKFGIQYPVVMDNDHATWDAYRNLYWPREYLIDIDGFIVHDKIGEGDYDGTEKAIQKALKERSDVLGLGLVIPNDISNPKDIISMDEGKVKSPETYFGSERNQYLGNGAEGLNGSQTLSLPATIDPNTLYLDGVWNFQGQFAENTTKGAKIIFKYNSKNVYFVASAKNPVKVKVLLDGAPIGAAMRGADVASDGTVTISDNRLYDIVKGMGYGEHTLELDVDGQGLDAFTFTFG